MKVSARDLKNKTGSVLRQIRAGKSVLLTYRGRPIAKMTSLEQTSREMKEAFGIWAEYKETEDVEAFLERLRGSRF